MVSARILLIGLLGTGVLTGCGGKGGSPDEFSVLPTKPLEQPPSYRDLPVPNLAGQNRADQRPLVDSVIALGGDSARLNSTRTSASEQALIIAVDQYGVDDDIRNVLAAEVEQGGKRTRNDRLLYRLFGRPDPKGRGAKDALDADAELVRLRLLGVRTPGEPSAN